MNLTIVIILCAIIALALILLPLIVSRKAETIAKNNEWNKIKEFGNKINKQTRNNKK
jgi:cell division protein FtsL